MFHAFFMPVDTSNLGEDALSSPSLSILSISNISVEADFTVFYLHALLLWILSGWVYFLLWRMWRTYYSLRRQYFASKDFQENHSNRCLLLTLVPTELQNPDSLIFYLAKKRINPMPRQVVIGRDAEVLTKFVVEHDKLTILMESSIIKYIKSGYTKRPRHRPDAPFYSLGFFGGEELDTLEYCHKNLLIIEVVPIYSNI
jgi:hypothetical protein